MLCQGACGVELYFWETRKKRKMNPCSPKMRLFFVETGHPKRGQEMAPKRGPRLKKEREGS